MISQNLSKLKASLPPHVKVVAVSKNHSVEAIREAYEAGQRDFGENYVQELIEKKEQLPADIRWHFIGHLQSNKVKYIAPFVHLIHGVDSFRLLKEINKNALKNKRVIACLLQMHIAQEETKFGLSSEEVYAILESDELKKMEGIHIRGLMGMASNTNNTEQISLEFQVLKKHFNDIKKRRIPHVEFEIVSMGMSHDFGIAVTEGTNMLRIGSKIFGERIYT